VISETRLRHSRNLTILILILFFFAACAYSRILFKYVNLSLNAWEVAICYWVVLGVALRNWRFLFTQLFSLFAFAAVLTVLQENTFALTYPMLLETTGRLSPPVFIILFVVGPAIFFSFNFDPYGLVRELPQIANVRATAHLLLMLSAGEMFRARFAEVSQNLIVRGVDLKKRGRRILSAPTFLPPLLMALIQEAAYRHSYALMLGCPAGKFPVQSSQTRVSPGQKVGLAAAVLMLLGRVFI